jgi:hypothetical protein
LFTFLTDIQYFTEENKNIIEIFLNFINDSNQYLLEFCTTRLNLDKIKVRFLFIKNLNKSTQSLVKKVLIKLTNKIKFTRFDTNCMDLIHECINQILNKCEEPFYYILLNNVL